MSAPKFPLGRVVATPNALENVWLSAILEASAVISMATGEPFPKRTKNANETALKVGSRLLSAYHTVAGRKFWIITEADRSVTTIPTPGGLLTWSNSSSWFPRKRPKAHVPKSGRSLHSATVPFVHTAPYATIRAVAAYWREHIVSHPTSIPTWVLCRNPSRHRRRVTGHHLVGVGMLDSVIVHAREVFRTAIIAGAHAVIVAHNHPSGSPTPSDADIRTTKDLVRAGQLLKVELLDHVVMGTSSHNSLKGNGIAVL